MKSHETAINHHFFVQNTGEIQDVSPLFMDFLGATVETWVGKPHTLC